MHSFPISCQLNLFAPPPIPNFGRKTAVLMQGNFDKSNLKVILAILGAVVLLSVLPLRERLKGHYRARVANRPSHSDSSSTSSNLDRRETFPVLADSILSVVKSYYVDPKRVDNEKLLDITLATLKFTYNFNYERDPKGFVVQLGDAKKKIRVPRDMDYQKLVDIFADLASSIDAVPRNSLPSFPEEKSDTDGASRLLNAMLFGLDAHSALLSQSAYRELKQGTEGSFGGLGLLVGIRDQLLTVIKPLPRSPAYRAGIKKYDRILKIDGIDTFGYSLDQVVDYMRGDPGTDVALSLLRDGGVSPFSLKLQREIINVDSVTARHIKKNRLNILSLEIDTFSSRTASEVAAAINKAKTQLGELSGIILDLRSNPGGLLDQAVLVANEFIKTGVIVSTKGRREEVERAVFGRDEHAKIPIVVLVNNDSASASEIVAGALKDNNRALVIGQPSFGKGSVQTIFELPGERALKLTIARYYTPSGRSIQNVGIIPDIWIHPIYRVKKNENLLGHYRYQNEGFLQNHLEDQEPDELTEGQDVKSSPAIKTYYLSDMYDSVDDTKVLNPDREMEVATTVIEQIAKTYGLNPPPEARRASHWLALAAPAVKKRLSKLEAETNHWLLTNLGINWEQQINPVKPNIGLEVNRVSHEIPKAGDVLNFEWTAKNIEPYPVGRLSVFVRSYQKGIETKEVLIGKLLAQELRKGQISIQIPPKFDPGPLKLWFGFAIDGEAVKSVTVPHTIEISGKSSAVLSSHTELVDEIGGEVPGVLEGSEQARIKVFIKNDSEVDAHQLKVNIVNLAGRQVVVSKAVKSIDSLAPGEERAVLIDIQGSREIVSKAIPLGLEIDSSDLVSPLRKSFSIQAMPKGVLSAH